MAKNITTDTQQYSRKKNTCAEKVSKTKCWKQVFRLYSESSINIYCSFNFISIFRIDLNLRLSFSVSTRFNAVFKIEISLSSWQNRARKKKQSESRQTLNMWFGLLWYGFSSFPIFRHMQSQNKNKNYI